MLEERMERVKSRLVERLTDGMDLVVLGQIREKGIAPLLTRWLTDQAEALLRQEQERRSDTGLGYDHPRAKVILERLDEVLLDVTVFPRTQIEQVVEEQIRWETMLRMRPVKAMVQFFLPQEGTLSISELVASFPKLPVQAFYGEGLRAYADKHPQETVDRETLESILHEIEKRELSVDAVGVIMNAATTTLEFLKQRRVEDGDEIDLDIIGQVLTYYRMGVQARVIQVEQMLGRERLSLGQMRRILEMTGHFTEGDEPETELPSVDVGGDIRRMEEEEENAEEMRNECEEEARKGQEDTLAESQAPELPNPVMEDRMEDVFEVVEKPEGVFQIRLDDKEERYFIRKLFAKDREIYEALMAQLRGISEWEEANRTIEKFLEDHGIDADSRAAGRFLDAYYGCYDDSP
ncbi:MAG: hypothetical protein V1800_13160 [Candidatus Latescibacterota bacterium]